MDRNASNRKQRARKYGAAGSFSECEWQYLLRTYGHKCLRCGVPEAKEELHRDHVLPLSKGGCDTIDNIQCLCQSCNSIKNIKHIDYRPFPLPLAPLREIHELAKAVALTTERYLETYRQYAEMKEKVRKVSTEMEDMEDKLLAAQERFESGEAP